MQESLVNYEKKIVEITEKIALEKEALIAKRGDAEKKLAEAKAKFAALYGDLDDVDEGQGAENAQENNGLFDQEVEG
jgi:hypothetical protein